MIPMRSVSDPAQTCRQSAPHRRSYPLLTATLVAALFLPIARPASGSCGDALCPETTVDLRTLLGRPLPENVLKLFDAAVDPVRGRVYVSGIKTRSIAVLDAETQSWIGVLDSGTDGTAYRYLAVDPVGNRLFVMDGIAATLTSIDPESGQRIGPVAVQNGVGQLAVDPTRGLLFHASEGGVRAYDATTLNEVWNTLGGNTGAMVYAQDEDLLYVLDGAATGPVRTIHLVDPASGFEVGQVHFSAPGGTRSKYLDRDPATGRLVTFAGSVQVLEADGSPVSSFSLPAGHKLESLLFDSAHGTIVTLLEAPPADGEVASSQGILRVHRAEDGTLVEEVMVGRKPHRTAFDRERGRIYIPEGDASTVWRLDTSIWESPVGLRLGDSVEGVVEDQDGRWIYLNSRLGGSYLMAYDSWTGELETFASGTWPTPIRTDDAREHLFVLDAWDGTVSVFDLRSGHSHLATIATGLPRGTTDRLPDLAIDSVRHLAFAAFPEFAAIGVVDWDAGEARAPLLVPRYPKGDVGGGAGELQVKVHEGLGIVYAWWGREHRLTLFSADGGTAPIAQVDLSTLDWSSVHAGSDKDHFFVDEQQGVVFAGRFELDPRTGTPTGRRLAAGYQIVGTARDGTAYWAWELREGRYLASRLDRSDLSLLDQVDVGPEATLAPSLLLSAVDDRLWVGALTEVQLSSFTPAGADDQGGDGNGGDPGGDDEGGNGNQPTEPAACGDTVLCVHQSRFRVEVEWTDSAGGSGVGHAVPFSDETGSFWFFSAANVELMIKVLDGRAFNDHWWVFYGSLSNVEFTVRVTDTETGASWTHQNPQGTFASGADTHALAD